MPPSEKVAKLTYKPVFLGLITLLCQLPLQLFLTFWCAMFFGGMLAHAHLDMFAGDPDGYYTLFGGLAFFLTPSVIFLAKKFNYMNTEYVFYDDRLEFEEGFFTIKRKVIRLRDIKEVDLRKGVFQRLYGLGSIYLATAATGSSSGYSNPFSALGFASISSSGVAVRDVENSDDAYEKIKSLVDTQSSS